jgi:hypothetical protein
MIGLLRGRGLDLDSRIRSALALYAFAVLGLFLLVAPWTPIWTRATIALAPTPAGPWIGSGWVRGLVSGLGALDLAVALQVLRELWSRMREQSEGPP